MTLKEKYDNDYERFSYFCKQDQVDFYFDENFEDKLKEVTQNLDSEEKYFYKYLFLRSLFVNFIRKDNFYTEEEVELQKEFTEFRKNNIEGNKISEFKFTGDYNLHPFIGFSLDETSLNFLKDKDIIDAGAFTGDTSLPLSKLTNANVYAFEPFDESYELLNKNIKDNDIKNIVPVKKSLGNIEGTRSLYLAGNNVQGITSDADFRKYDTELKVNETTIDTFVDENNLNVGFIIVDVEGAELDLLEGAKNTIMTQKPILTISIYHRLKDFVEIIPWIANLDLGYEFKILRESPWSFISDTSVLCIPKKCKK
jgi:FkbM family methyltransferase